MSDSETVYAVRLVRSVTQMIVSEHSRQETLSNPATADQWKDGLMDAIRSLATYPERCPVARENPLFETATLRHLIYYPRRGGPAWRILFTVHEKDENDPPIVWVHLIRHSAQAPLTEWPPDEEAA